MANYEVRKSALADTPMYMAAGAGTIGRFLRTDAYSTVHSTKLNACGFEGDSSEFCASTDCCGWGTSGGSSLYQYQGSGLPIASKYYMPHPYLVKNSSTWYRQFPTSDVAAANNHGVAVKYIPISESLVSYYIAYDVSTQRLNVTTSKGDTLLSEVASPQVMIDVQAPGGKGGIGNGEAFLSSMFTMDHIHLGGGGGGSGAFATFTFTAGKEGRAVQLIDDGTIRVTLSGARDSFSIGAGKDGLNGLYSIGFSGSGYPYLASTTLGAGGAGGVVRQINDGSGGDSTSPKIGNFDVGYLVDWKDGVSGSNGARVGGLWSNPEREGAPPSEDLASRDMYCGGARGGVATCSIYGTTNSTIVGFGETVAQTQVDGYFAGGGGGAPTLMSSGGTFASAAGIGAGGYGGSAWASSRGASSTGEGGAGGGGALWVYYIPM